jgi:phenylacetate-CoA ligase
VFHNLICQHVAWPLMRLQRRLRPSHSHAVQVADFRPRAFSWTHDAKETWILEQLRAAVRQAATNTVHYAALFNEIGFDPFCAFSFDDFARLPVLDRSVIHSAGETLISTAADRGSLRTDASGGSSGEPVRIWVGPTEDLWHSTAREFFMRSIGVPVGSRIAYFWGHHLDPRQETSTKTGLDRWLSNERWFDCFRLSPTVLEQYHEELQQYRPDCIIAYASALHALCQFLSDHRIRPNYPRKCIVTGAEKLYDSQRVLAEKIFQHPIHERYGSRDAGMIGFQMHATQKDFIVDWVNLLVEPETKGSESSILVTKLHADGMPMIRYRIGDIGLFPSDSRPGYPTFTLHNVVGRTLDRIWLPDGRFIHGAQFPHMMKDFPVREFQVVQDSDYSVHIQIVPLQHFCEDNRTSILNIVCANLPGLPVTLALSQSIPKTRANKWRPVESRLNHVGLR